MSTSRLQHGGGGSIGAAVARTFAAEGAAVFLAGRTREPLQRVAAEVTGSGGHAEVAVLDATDEHAVDQHADAVATQAGSIDVSFNLITRGDAQGTPIIDMRQMVNVSCGLIQGRRPTATARAASAGRGPRRRHPRGSSRGSLSVTVGADRLRGWWPGDGLEKVFCGDCGSAVLARDRTSGEVAVVRLGAIEGDPHVRPSAHQLVAYASPWEPIPDDGLPRFPERIPLDAMPAVREQAES